jgi:hypothetical protein
MHLALASFPKLRVRHLALLLVLLPGARPATAAQSRAFILTTDYSTGGVSAVNLDTRYVSKDVASVYSDAAQRWFGGELYVVNRYGSDNIQELDCGSTWATHLQFSTGAGTNPQDIACLNTHKAFVSLYERSAVLVCDPETGATLDTISLSAFADGDHLPEMAHLALVDHRLFVAVQRINRLAGYVPDTYSLVVVIDADADTVIDTDPLTPGVQAIRLTARNPVTAFTYLPATQRLLIGCAGYYGVNDGGIEAIDVSTLRSAGLIATEAQLGGDIGDFEWWSASHSYAIVSDPAGNASLVAFNPANGAMLGTVRSPGGFSLPDCAIDDRGELYVADNGVATAGIYVYRAGADTLIAGPLDTGLPPNQIAFDAQNSDVAAVPASLPPLAVSLLAPWPNPARERVTFGLALPRDATVRVEVFDLAGRRVALIAEGARPAGESRIAWRPADERGRALDPGIYLVRARIGGRSETRRFAVVR